MFRNKKLQALGKHQTQQPQKKNGFTLIELLVVVAIISLLSSIALIALQQARQKSRDVKRLGDITQMNTALELYFNVNKGYPQGVGGKPVSMIPDFVVKLPVAPEPADGACDGVNHSGEVTADNGTVVVPANTYYYIGEGSGATSGGLTVYPSYTYYFCLGYPTGNFAAGERIFDPGGLK